MDWWLPGDRRLDPAEGLQRVFGDFDFIGALEGLRTPGIEVLAYRPGSKRGRSRFEPFPPNVWLEAAPRLWLCHDGKNLLLSADDPLLADNLATRAARE